MHRFTGLFVLFLLSACGGAAPIVVAPVVPEAPSGPAFEALYLQNGTLVHHDLSRNERSPLDIAAATVSAVHAAPTGGSIAFVLSSSDSTRLGLWEEDIRILDAQPGEQVITLDWAPDGTALAFGQYRPTSRGRMGAGQIQWMERGGRINDVGCSASKAVLAWLPDDGLLVRNDDNLYVVARDGCATRRSIDARRMNALTVSPDGARYAYVHRDLVYNRARRAYEADSTMMLAATAGGDPRTVVSFKYAPRRFAWSPDGSELAFDVESQDEPGRRLVSVFSTETGSTSYLHPPQSGAASESEPVWSPAGSRVLFRQGSAWATRAFADRFAMPVPKSDGFDWAGWATEDVPVFRRPDGSLALLDLQSGVQTPLPADIVLVAVRPLPASL